MFKKTLQGISRQFSGTSTFKAADLEITRQENKGLEGIKNMQFGATHTSHMFIADCVEGVWDKPKIVPYAPLQIDPFNSTLHYSVSCFEGMKAYLDAQNRIRLFRPDMNMARFQKAIHRVSMFNCDPKELLKCLEEFVKVEKNWIPKEKGKALYLRPFSFSMENTLGVKPPLSSRIMIVASPVGNYFEEKFKPITLGVCREYERGNPKSAAGYKVSPNYGPTIQISGEMKAKYNCDQVLWVHDDKVLEVGACNIFFLLKDKSGQLELITSPLDGSILPGVTRDSVLALEREKKRYKVSERYLTISELKQAGKENRIVEIFGTGTAVCIMPVATIRSFR
jgi:branched-chain amino acid aminotransferase